VRSLRNKIDELQHVILLNQIYITVITETWLNTDIPDDTIKITGYMLASVDRRHKNGEGICVYIKDRITYNVVQHDKNDKSQEIETLWITIRPQKLPIEISCILLGCIYHPLGGNDWELTKLINSSIDDFLQIHPYGKIIRLGDFNKYKDKYLYNYHKLRQVVNKLQEKIIKKKL
jgi:exonuclease III